MRNIPVPISSAMTRILQVDDQTLTPRDKSVLSWLLSYACIKTPTKPIFPRVETLSQCTGLSVSSIKRAINKLETNGYITRLSQERGKSTGNFLTRRTSLCEKTLIFSGLLNKTSNISTQQERGKDIEDESRLEKTAIKRPENELRPEFNTVPAIENELRSPTRKNNKSTDRAPQNSSIPDDLKWLQLDHQIPAPVIFWAMKALRMAGTTLSAVAQTIQDRLRDAKNATGYLSGVVRRIMQGKDLWKNTRPMAVQSHKDVERKEKAIKRADEKWGGGRIYTDHQKTWIRVVSAELVEIYSEHPASTAAIPKARKTLRQMLPDLETGKWKSTEPDPASIPHETGFEMCRKALKTCTINRGGVQL